MHFGFWNIHDPTGIIKLKAYHTLTQKSIVWSEKTKTLSGRLQLRVRPRLVSPHKFELRAVALLMRAASHQLRPAETQILHPTTIAVGW